MKVLIMFHIDDGEVRRIMDQDMHAEDLLDQINEQAVVDDTQLEVWHFGDASQAEVVRTVSALWENESKEVPTLGIIEQL